ncbi:sensor histidine kinase [Actinoplanes sp. NPDC051513]|uniref:sensor histidine kinase n=1 Tax=Actinoplanes sp. NPDC051513 TaxID=3363908 RepID=UPI00378CC854
MRWASVLNLAMHLALLVMAPILVATEAIGRHTADQVAFAIIVGGVLAAIHLRHLRAATRGDRPAVWPLTLTLQVVLVYAPLLWLGPDWVSTQLPLTASMMLLLPRPWGPVVGFTGPCLVSGIAYFFLTSQTLSFRDTILEMVYFAISFVVFVLMLYGTARLVRLVNELYRSRTELAELAADEERVRVSRDLHDLLGHSLSAISLKGDLAVRLLSMDPDRARDEITSLTELARSTLRDVRAVTRDEHQVTLRQEIAAAQGLLAAAGVDTRIDVDSTNLALSDDAQQVLAWAVREATTNLLRHSDATTCTITLTHAAGTIALDIRNDGVRQPLPGDGSGLAGLKDRAARAGGSASGQVSGDDEFHLRVELPETSTLMKHP